MYYKICSCHVKVSSSSDPPEDLLPMDKISLTEATTLKEMLLVSIPYAAGESTCSTVPYKRDTGDLIHEQQLEYDKPLGKER